MTSHVTDASIDIWPDRLLNMLKQQDLLLGRLSELAQRQGDLIRDGKNDELLQLLSERQQIIDRFLVMQQDMSGLTGNLERRLETIDATRRDEIRRLISHIGQRLDDVMQRDERDRHNLESNRDQSKQELAGLGNAGRARQAYLGASSGQARFADRQG